MQLPKCVTSLNRFEQNYVSTAGLNKIREPELESIVSTVSALSHNGSEFENLTVGHVAKAEKITPRKNITYYHMTSLLFSG